MSGADANDLALAAFQAWSAGEAARAETLARAALERDDANINALQVLAAACLRDGRVAEAAEHLQRAAGQDADNAALLNSLGVALRRLGDLDGARRAYRRAGELGLFEGWRNLALLERTENRLDAALDALSRALALQPEAAAIHAALAQIHERRHDLVRAREHAERALRTEPNNEVARNALGQVLVRERRWEEARALLTPLGQDASATPNNRAIAIGLVGEALDGAGDAQGAFDAFTAANAILKQVHGHHQANVAAPFHPDSVRRFTEFLAHEDVAAWRRPSRLTGRAPVFLVGFPRSGTTLLDQILSSNPAIACLEEKEILALQLEGLLDDPALATWRDMPDARIEAVRDAYWRDAAAAAPVPLDGRIVVDKLPLNLVLLPAIARFFPEARIIVALRDPRDVALSCYQQRFGMSPAMVQMLELGTTARYYDLVFSLYDLCRAKLPLRFHEVRYEDVVGDIEAAARGLAAFVGAPFDKAMLEFDRTARRRDINTPSARQVVQPLYSSSVGRWKRYAAQLAPALPVLERWAKKLGYGI